MKVFLFILGVFFLSASSCNEENTKGNSSGAVASSPSSKAESRNKQVVFFTPSSTELAETIEQTGDVEGTMSGIDDFENNVEKFMDSTGIPGLEVRITDTPEIRLTMENGEVFTLKRDKDNVYGAIFFDGVQQPKVTKGLYLDFEYRDLAHDYFGVK